MDRQEISRGNSNLSKDSLANSEEKTSKETVFSQQLLQELECPVCLEHIRPPFFMCDAGHNICGKCKLRVTNCPTCRGKLGGGRNFALESLASTMKYPCVNKSKGCSFESVFEEVKQHESHCQYMDVHCFIRTCQWTGLKNDLKKHLEDQHSDLLIQPDEKYTHLFENRMMNSKQYIYLHNDESFLLEVCSHSFSTGFAVLHVGSEKTNYDYNLKIFGSFGMSLTLSDHCQPVSIADIPNVTIEIPFSTSPEKVKLFWICSHLLSQFWLDGNQIQFALSFDFEQTGPPLCGGFDPQYFPRAIPVEMLTEKEWDPSNGKKPKWLGFNNEGKPFKLREIDGDRWRYIHEIYLDINKVEKIFNPYLERAFQLKGLLRGNFSEIEAYHGTNEENIDSIIKNNFNWRLAGQSKEFKHGKGVCFSQDVYFTEQFCRGRSCIIKTRILLMSSLIYCGDVVPKGGYDVTRLPDENVILKFEDSEFLPIFIIYLND